MSRRNDANKDVLSKIHEQIVKDQNNDSTQTGSFPVVRRKPKRVSLNAKATLRIVSCGQAQTEEGFAECEGHSSDRFLWSGANRRGFR